MLYTILQNVFIGLTNFAIHLPDPNAAFLASITTALTSIKGILTQLHGLTFIVPMQTFTVLLFTMIGLELALFIAVAGNWIIRIASFGIIK